MIQFLNNLWIALTNENVGLVNLMLIPATIIEVFLSMCLFLNLTQINTNKHQKKLYVLVMSLIALLTASVSDTWYVPKGISTTTRARFTALTTDLPRKIIWSSVMGSVVTFPAMTFEAESPTRMMSMPAPSTICAVVYASPFTSLK